MVTTTEAWLTIIFFCILVIMAFVADKAFARHLKNNQSKEEKVAEEE
jgi:preprotein translocase subunit SecG